MKVLCNKTTKKIESVSRWDNIDYDSNTHILLIVDNIPDIKNQRLNDNEDGFRLATQAELDIETDIELDQKIDFANVDPVFKAFILAINTGSIVPGSNMSGADLKAAIKAKM